MQEASTVVPLSCVAVNCGSTIPCDSHFASVLLWQVFVNARLHVSGGALGGGRMVEDESSVAGLVKCSFLPGTREHKNRCLLSQGLSTIEKWTSFFNLSNVEVGTMQLVCTWILQRQLLVKTAPCAWWSAWLLYLELTAVALSLVWRSVGYSGWCVVRQERNSE